MANITTNYSLQKPLDNESADISVINSNMDTIDLKIKEAIDKANSAFQSANDGKTDIATVVGSPVTSSDTFSQIKTKIQTIKDTIATNLTAKGVSALASETLSALASKISNILKGQGNATEPQVLSGATFTNDLGTLKTGTMPNRGAVTITPSSADQTIALGFHNGSGKVSAVYVPVAKVLNDTTIAGQQGTMPNNGALGGTLTLQGQSYNIPAGFTSGGTITNNISNLIASIIKQNEVVGGVTGTLVTDRLLQSLNENFGFPGGNTYPYYVDCYSKQLTADERAVRFYIGNYYQAPSSEAMVVKQDNGTWTGGRTLIPGSGNSGRLELFVDSSNIIRVRQYYDSYATEGYNMFSLNGTITVWK